MLQKLSVVNYKNYRQAEINFSEKINCLVGNNGVGKTNILDAIYYLSFTKSFFNAIDSQNINFEEDFFMIQGEYRIDDKLENIYCGVKRNSKKIFKRNQKEYQKLAEHIGLIPLVMMSPADINLISSGSEERRKFINGVISQFDKEYLELIINYNKALTHRNKLLKDFAKSNAFDVDMLETWNTQLIPLGNKIYEKRKQFVEALLPIFEDYYKTIAVNQENVKLEYTSDLHTQNFDELIKTSIEKDRFLQHTSKGIHKDDLEFKIHNFPLKRSASQGQQKTFLMSLKLAQFKFLQNLSGKKPILLLDDIFDKLDNNRVTQIVKMVSNEDFGQIFITDTSLDRIKNILAKIPIEHKIFNVEIENKEITIKEYE